MIHQNHLDELISIHGNVTALFEFPIDKRNSIVIAERELHPFANRPYVVWYYNLDNGFFAGKYDCTISQAVLRAGNLLSEEGF